VKKPSAGLEGPKDPERSLAHPDAKGVWGMVPARFHAALKRLKFTEPTEVQKLALPPALGGEDLLILAPTGTGKTLVYLLPTLQALDSRMQGGAAASKAPPPNSKALVLVPTRELAFQVAQMLQDLEPGLQRGIAVLVGGLPEGPQNEALDGPWKVIIATPGRLLDHLRKRPKLLKQVGLTVLDEFDRLVGMGFEQEVGAVLEALPESGQRLLLSATPQDEPLLRLRLPTLRTLQVTPPAGDARLVEQFFLLKTSKTKAGLLVEALQALAPGEQAIVFVNNIAKCLHLKGLLRLRGVESEFLHGHMKQEMRGDVFLRFREGKLAILVATDIAGRGFDIPEVALIVNYDLPKNEKQYVHRAGRTARRGRNGLCLSFAGPEDWLPMRNLRDARPSGLPYHPRYAQEEAWFRQAKRVHDIDVRRTEKADRVRKEQGLDE
jgi:superfamily II DNA/RNA helicase